MSGPTQPDQNASLFQQLPPDAMLRVNCHCDRLEAAWQLGREVDLPKFVAAVPVGDRAAALPELILIDLAYRQRLDLPRSADQYAAHFPELNCDWLNRQIARHSPSLATRPEPASTTSPQSTKLPERLGDYLIRGTLGSGGMGHVYRAVHELMGRVVAVKVMKEGTHLDALSRRRFEREVQALARLSHPNIVTAFDAREDSGRLFLVTELVEGEDLAKRVARTGPLPPLHAANYAWQAAQGLSYAHQQGIVHRDVKPSNLLLNRAGQIKVLDLGLARLHAGGSGESALNSASLTRPDQIVGTAAFMAPEQARTPLAADARVDVYSLGCTLYFLLTGTPPYRGESDLDTIMAHLEQPIPSLPTEVNGRKVPHGLSELIRAMMAKNPAERPESMADVVTALAAIAKTPSAPPTSTAPARKTLDGFQRRVGGLPVAAVALGFLSIATLVAGWWFASGGTAPEQATSVVSPTLAAAPPPSSTSIRPQIGSGLRFDGRTNYVAARNFDLRITGPFRLEVAARAERQPQPANLISWTGPSWAALFILPSAQWGIAFFDGTRSRLEVAQQPARYGELEIVAGAWDGERLYLFVDGKEVATESIDYPLQRAPVGLFIGGTPEGILPAEQGTRFFAGTIAAVRLLDQPRSPPAATLAEMRQPNPETIALFPLTAGSGTELRDLSPRQWSAEIFGARWFNEP